MSGRLGLLWTLWGTPRRNEPLSGWFLTLSPANFCGEKWVLRSRLRICFVAQARAKAACVPTPPVAALARSPPPCPNEAY